MDRKKAVVAKMKQQESAMQNLLTMTRSVFVTKVHTYSHKHWL